MKYRKRLPLSARDIQLLILIGIVTVAVLGTLVGADIRLSQGLRGGGGFFASWEGARTFLVDHASPYSLKSAAAIQQGIYGRPAHSGENPYYVTTPFFLLMAYFPLALIPDAVIARGLWMFVSEAALVGTAFLSLRLIEWRPKRLFQIAFALFSVFGLYAVVALIDGGPAVLLGLLYPAALTAYYYEQDELAGALLVFGLFAWEIGLLFVVLLLWKTLYDRRWRVLAGLGMTLVALLVVSLLVYPGWVLPFFTIMVAALRTPYGTTASQVLSHLFPGYVGRGPQIVTVLLIVLLLYEWAATRGADFRRFIWAAFLTLAVTPLLGFRLELTNLVVLIPGLALVFAATASRWRGGYWIASFLLLAAFVLPWGWFLRWSWLGDQRAQDIVMVFLPIFAAIGLYWTRWWFLRPPRTWFDHVRTELDPKGRIARSKSSTNPLR